MVYHIFKKTMIIKGKIPHRNDAVNISSIDLVNQRFRFHQLWHYPFGGTIKLTHFDEVFFQAHNKMTSVQQSSDVYFTFMQFICS